MKTKTIPITLYVNLTVPSHLTDMQILKKIMGARVMLQLKRRPPKMQLIRPRITDGNLASTAITGVMRDLLKRDPLA